MTRLLLCLALALLVPALPAPTLAKDQPGTRAYAPEDLRQLSTQDQIRVLEKEYREQSGGRELPDDQLDFYLDQVQSGWTFSRIKADMAQSLRGQGSGWRPPSGGGWNRQTVICSSIKERYAECRTPFPGRAIVVENISDTRCVEGRNWGGRPGMVWVDDGCRARFAQGRGGYGPGSGYPGGPGQSGPTVRCESIDGRYRRCNTNFRGRAELVRQLSKKQCVEGRNWGSRRGEVWVDDGCRAEFADSAYQGGGYGGYSVTCSSIDGRYATCAWNNRYGPPRVIEQLSGKACVEGRTWGYRGNALWVDDGCRARFGPR